MYSITVLAHYGDTSDMTGQLILHYRVATQLGGMSDGYEAEDLKLHHHVALNCVEELGQKVPTERSKWSVVGNRISLRPNPEKRDYRHVGIKRRPAVISQEPMTGYDQYPGFLWHPSLLHLLEWRV